MDQTLITVITSASTALVTKGIEGPINSFNDLWYGAVGHSIKAWSEVRKLKAFENYNKILEDMANNLNKIPQENLKDPDASIVGPALESAKYYCDQEMLRKMFAKVISSNMDNRLSSKVHHSFVEIIKQLSPIEAEFINDMSQTLPLGDIVVEYEPSGQNRFFNYFYLDPIYPDPLANSVTISNLLRLGIIWSPGSLEYFSEDRPYQYILQSSKYIEIRDQIITAGYHHGKKVKSVKFQKSYFDLTPYGKNFKEICTP
ncbi:DUF4393 domain-containing protein [Proteiniclasticum sp. QWL-01]|uniref:DUF4393 domain-containing protein n=1 Tax=Proteiniclasticum sp. QWL-01 TaxID=3036945 RepID=UPI0024118AD2|nr:DUF4393 domain-containing protein [Proteiniclasticum sp. QWL-01]WFF74007.1 DUF4393 domain-containing protein [Proteiniclasticum sp. QWL-01]